MSYAADICRQVRQPVRVTASTDLPVSLAELRAQARISTEEEDGKLTGYIRAAQDMVEREAEIALLTSTWALYLDGFPEWEIELRISPIQSITSIVYLDSTGTSQTLATSKYRTDFNHKPGRIEPAYQQIWPVTYAVSNAITVTMVAGAATAETSDAMARQAILFLASHWYMNAEPVGSVGQKIELTYEALIDRIRWAGGI